MYLLTAYAPAYGPSLIISTWWAPDGPQETTMALLENWSTDDTLIKWFQPGGSAGCVKVAFHKSVSIAECFHLHYARRLHNGGGHNAWEKSMAAYEECVALIESCREAVPA